MSKPAPAPVAAPAPAPAGPPPTAPAAPKADAAIAQTPPADAKPDVAKVRVRGYERAQKVKDQLASIGDTTESAKEIVASGQTAKEAAGPGIAKTEAPADETAEQRRAERIERIRMARDKERGQQEDRQRQRRQLDAQREIETLRRRVSELEPHAEVFRSEEALLTAAERQGMSAEKLIGFMRQRLTTDDGGRQPANEPRQAPSGETAELRQMLQQLQQKLDRTEADRRADAEREQTSRSLRNRTEQFKEAVRSGKGSHPLVSQMAGRHGETGLIAFANQFVAPLLPRGYTVEELLDHTEQILDEVQVGSATGTPAAAQAAQPAKNAAAQAPSTLSNGLVAERVSVEEEKPLHLMPRLERVRRLKHRLGDPAA